MVEAVAARDPDAAREAFAAHVNRARTRLLSADFQTEKGSA
jgi:DNA-binding GntR family transcriptional regulator